MQMPRRPTPTEFTNARSHNWFKSAASALGQAVDARTDRRHAVLVDGVPLGERQGEMRKPDTSFYEKTFTEAAIPTISPANRRYRRGHGVSAFPRIHDPDRKSTRL